MYGSAARFASLSALFLLAACGGGDRRCDSSGPYEPLRGAGAGTDSALGGAAVRWDGSGDVVSLALVDGSPVSRITGTLRGGGGRAVLTIRAGDESSTLTDGDGFDPNGVLEDGESSGIIYGADVMFAQRTYEYVTPHRWVYPLEDVPGVETTRAARGVFGVITDAGDIPTGDETAYYSGTAAGRANLIATKDVGGSRVSEETAYNLNAGTSLIIVDFGDGTVNVTMDNFEVEDVETGLEVSDVSFGTIRAEMMVDGNRFSGGAVTVENGAMLGEDQEGRAEGAFFGYDSANSRPDEIGGVAARWGSTGHVGVMFIAD